MCLCSQKQGFRRCASAVNRLGGESFYVLNAARQRVALDGQHLCCHVRVDRCLNVQAVAREAKRVRETR